MLDLFLVFIATIVADWIWAAYITHTANKRAFKAALFSMLIVCISSFVTLSYIHDRRAIIAAALGAFVGTFIFIRFSKKEK